MILAHGQLLLRALRPTPELCIPYDVQVTADQRHVGGHKQAHIGKRQRGREGSEVGNWPPELPTGFSLSALGAGLIWEVRRLFSFQGLNWGPGRGAAREGPVVSSSSDWLQQSRFGGWETLTATVLSKSMSAMLTPSRNPGR